MFKRVCHHQDDTAGNIKGGFYKRGKILRIALNRNIEKETEIYRKKGFKGNTMSIKPYISIITHNVNGLKVPIKWPRVADWIKRQDLSICCLQQTHLEPKDTSRLKVKGWRSIFHANGPQNKSGVAILISEKLDFRRRSQDGGEVAG